MLSVLHCKINCWKYDAIKMGRDFWIPCTIESNHVINLCSLDNGIKLRVSAKAQLS